MWKNLAFPIKKRVHILILGLSSVEVHIQMLQILALASAVGEVTCREFETLAIKSCLVLQGFTATVLDTVEQE